ncbi:AAA family ATPase [Vogesella indigofera]|uniref:AAA family ATPase n=1 Tax=Vogesella indigofera TaxID=45465 RepID=UPI0035B40EFE
MKIESIEILGLWGQEKVEINFNEEINFIIGMNGTGKTTIINIMAAALTLDLEKLIKFDFNEINFSLKSQENRKKPRIKISKGYVENESLIQIRYAFKKSSSDTWESYEISPWMIDAQYSNDPTLARSLAMRKARISQHEWFNIESIKNTLADLVSINLLSINRANNQKETRGESTRSGVERKITDLVNDMLQHFGALEKKYNEGIIEFQKKTLLAALVPEKKESVIAISEIDLNSDREALSKMLDLLGVDREKSRKSLNRYVNVMESTLKSVGGNNKAITIDEIVSLYYRERTQFLIKEYYELEEKRKEIFKKRDLFAAIINALLGNRKQLTVSKDNNLIFTSKTGKTIKIDDLSSGEKQLIILLGETLLQHERNVIYIADEPELSLHVAWQDALVDAIRSLNPNVQIIFATHSPDIVGKYQERVIDMETVLR